MTRSIAPLAFVLALGLAACQDDSPPEWTAIGEWEGADSVRTEPFTMEGDTLRVAWFNDFGPVAGGNLLQVFVLDAEGEIDTLVVNWAGRETDTTDVVLEPGQEYSLLIRPTNARFEVTALDKR